MSNQFLGRWDLTVDRPGSPFPSWVEIVEGPSGLSGRYVGIWGGSAELGEVTVSDDALRFVLPESMAGFPYSVEFTAKLEGDRLVGLNHDKEGHPLPFVGLRAPALPAVENPVFGDPIDLCANGLSDWMVRSESIDNHWSAVGGALVNAAAGTDILTKQTFQDFRLEVEYSYPKDSNSGIYLRGRYELQVVDDYGDEPYVGGSGAIYGFVKPLANAVKPFGERNHMVITLLGRYLTIVLNGQAIHDSAEIPGVTGGALDSREGEPGPILLQGDHGPVTYHKVVLTPVV